MKFIIQKCSNIILVFCFENECQCCFDFLCVNWRLVQSERQLGLSPATLVTLIAGEVLGKFMDECFKDFFLNLSYESQKI